MLGLEIQYHQCRAVVVSIDGTLRFKKTIPLNSRSKDFSEVFFDIVHALKKDIRSLGIPLIGIGVGIPGWVNPDNGLIVNSLSLKLKNYDFASAVASKMEIPVLIDNDANCCAWGELVASKDKGPKNFLYIFARFNTKAKDYKKTGVVGIGIGVVFDDKVYYGNNFSAGEFRSVKWKNINAEQVGIPSEELIEINKNPSVLKAFIKELGINLSVVISIFNPGRIYIGGELCKHYNLVMDVIRKELRDFYIGNSENGCDFQPADYDEYDVAAGAADMYIEKLFDIPKLRAAKTYYSLTWETVFARLKSHGSEKSKRITL